MPATALQRFGQDIARADAVLRHSDSVSSSDEELASDLRRSAWMFAVGALDAYFSDAYSEVVAATAIAQSRCAAMQLPEFFYDIRVPIRAVLAPYAAYENWRWRMAARRMMDRENVLSLETIRRLFNRFLRDDRKFFSGLVPDWIQHSEAKRRLFGLSAQEFASLPPKDRNKAAKAAASQFEERFRDIFQRRHDCIHNCDRPRMSPQPLKKSGTVAKVIQDVEFLVRRSDEHLQLEIREFLLACHCSKTVIAQVGY